MTPKPLILAVETSSRIGSIALAEGPDILAESTFSAPLTHSQELFPSIQQLLARFERRPKQIEQIFISIGPGSFTGLRIAVAFAKMMHLANQTKIVPVNTMDVIAANVIHVGTYEPTEHSAASSTLGHSGPKEASTIKNSESRIENRESSHEIVATILDAKRGQFFIAAYAPRCHLAPSFAVDSPDNHTSQDSIDEPLPTSHEIWHKILPDSLISAEEFLATFARTHRPLGLLGDGLLYYKDKFGADGVQFFDEIFWSPHASKVHQLGWRLALAGRFADPLTLKPHYLRGPDVTIKKNL